LKPVQAPAAGEARPTTHVMTAENWSPHPVASAGRRRRDRRRNIAGLCAALVASLTRTEGEALRSRLLDGLRRLLPGARTVTIRDWQAGGVRLEPPSQKPLVSFEIPTSDPRRIAVLDVLPGEGRTLDDWDLQTLALSSQIGALVLEIESLRRPSRADALTVTINRPDGAAPLIGSTDVMQELRKKIERVAATNFTVLIEGESGTGKELVARQIHDLSGRRDGPFVAINCAALVETLIEAELFGIEERTATGVRGRRGKFEHADNGTLFLDEVSDLSLSAQAKLLRAIQDLAVERVGGQGTHRVDIRIVAATNRSLRTLVNDGLFRADLFYRLSGVEIHVPPLRQRQSDVIELAHYFLERHRATRRLDLAPEAADVLLTYQWPGNVRELQRVIENVICLAQDERVGLDDLPPGLREDYETFLLPSITRDDTLRAWASRYARLVWHRCGQNKRRACRSLGISYHTLDAHLRYKPRAASAASRVEWADDPPRRSPAKSSQRQGGA
jgi:DNA-binding NtrC family response regulator